MIFFGVLSTEEPLFAPEEAIGGVLVTAHIQDCRGDQGLLSDESTGSRHRLVVAGFKIERGHMGQNPLTRETAAADALALLRHGTAPKGRDERGRKGIRREIAVGPAQSARKDRDSASQRGAKRPRGRKTTTQATSNHLSSLSRRRSEVSEAAHPPIRISRTAREMVNKRVNCLCCSLKAQFVPRGRHDCDLLPARGPRSIGRYKHFKTFFGISPKIRKRIFQLFP